MSNRPLTRAFRTSVALATLVVAPVLGLAGCGKDTTAKVTAHAIDGGAALPADTAGAAGSTVDTLAPPTRLAGSAVTLDAIDNDFTPKHAVVKAGTKVTFANTGHNAHDITPTDPGVLDFTVPSEAFGIGRKATFTFSRPGTYAYYCTLHASATAGSMRGVITVVP